MKEGEEVKEVGKGRSSSIGRRDEDGEGGEEMVKGNKKNQRSKAGNRSINRTMRNCSALLYCTVRQ